MTEANSDINRTYLYITTQLKSGYCKHSDTESSRTHIMVNSMNSKTHRAKVTSTPNKTGGGVAGVVTEVVTSTPNQMEGGTVGVVTE